MSPATPDPEFDIPDDDEVVAQCPHCNRPFLETQLHDLHLGEMHRDECTESELETYSKATERERDDLYLFHIRAVVALGVIYATSVIGYTAVVALLG